jgi:hypothetical protein
MRSDKSPRPLITILALAVLAALIPLRAFAFVSPKPMMRCQEVKTIDACHAANLAYGKYHPRIHTDDFCWLTIYVAVDMGEITAVQYEHGSQDYHDSLLWALRLYNVVIYDDGCSDRQKGIAARAALALEHAGDDR